MSEMDYREKRRVEDERLAALLRQLKEVKTLDELLGVVRTGAAFALEAHIRHMTERDE